MKYSYLRREERDKQFSREANERTRYIYSSQIHFEILIHREIEGERGERKKVSRERGRRKTS